ncbi:tetratricopeptide repeat protein [Moraxella sp. TY5]
MSDQTPSPRQSVHHFLETPLPMANWVTDLDNPLIERRYKDDQPLSTHHKSNAVNTFAPVAYWQSYDIPNFDHLSMAEDEPTPVNLMVENTTVNNQLTSDINLATDLTTDSANANPLHTNNLNPNSSNSANPSSPKATNKQRNQKLNTKSLSSRQAIAEAKRQQKQLAQQQAEQQAQLAKEAEAKRQAEIAEALANPRIHESLLNQRHSMVETGRIQQDTFSELEHDLLTIDVTNMLQPLPPKALATYEKAVGLLNELKNAQIDSADISNYQKAYAVVQKIAEHQSSDAMLRQALYLLRGNAILDIAQSPQQAIELVKNATKFQDNRAEKLLSKLYFSGEIVGMDSEQAKFWLAQSASHGHAEAQRLQQSFALVNELKDTRLDEDNYLQKLAIGVGVLVVFALIIIFAVKI